MKQTIIGVKHILRYFKGTTNMSLFHPNDSDSDQWVMNMHVILHILTMSQWLITNKMFVHMWYIMVS